MPDKGTETIKSAAAASVGAGVGGAGGATAGVLELAAQGGVTALSASAISAWLQIAWPSGQTFLENGSRTTAPGCQSGSAPAGLTASTLSTSSAKSCTHGAKILVSKRPAACSPNGGSEVTS